MRGDEQKIVQRAALLEATVEQQEAEISRLSACLLGMQHCAPLPPKVGNRTLLIRAPVECSDFW